jgi:hypothetical protein
VPTRPAVVGAASHPPQRSPDQAAPSFSRPLRRPAGGVISPPHGQWRLVAHVKSVRGAVPVFRPARFPGPLPEPAVRLSPQRALRKSQVGLTGLLVQRGLDLQYPSFRPREGGLWIAGIHRRNLLIFHRRPLLTYWTPSPCTELSSARTTTGPPPHPPAVGRQRTCPPPKLAARWEGDRGDGSHVHLSTIRSGRCPAISR